MRNSRQSFSLRAFQVAFVCFLGCYLHTNAIARIGEHIGGGGQADGIPMATPHAWADTLNCGYHVTCSGGSDGIAHAILDGGVSPISYLWSTGDTTADLAGLSAGMYSVTITDANGSYVDSVLLIEPAPISLTWAATTSLCLGDSNGMIDITIAGGNDCDPYSVVWSNGAVTEDIWGIPAGSYDVTIIDQSGCDLDMGFEITAYPNPTPDLGPDMNQCPGSPVYLYPGDFNSYWWSTNDTSSAIIVNQSGTYSVEVVDSFGCRGADTIVIGTTNVLTNFIQYDGKPILCIGDVATLSLAPGFVAPVWNTGATTNSITVSGMGGLFSVEATDSNGCRDYDDIAVPYLPYPAPVPHITPGPVAYHCPGSPVTLHAGSGYFAYEWSTVATTSAITVTDTGYYYVTVSNGYGCTGISATYVENYPTPNVTITLTSDTLRSTQFWATYQWLQNGAPIFGGFLNYFVPTQLGDYALVVTDGYGCGDTSNVIQYNPVAISDPNANVLGLHLFPNPAHGSCTLKSEKPISGAVEITLTDVVGRTVQRTTLRSLQATSLDISQLEAGIYLVTVRTEKQGQSILRLDVR